MFIVETMGEQWQSMKAVSASKEITCKGKEGSRGPTFPNLASRQYYELGTLLRSVEHRNLLPNILLSYSFGCHPPRALHRHGLGSTANSVAFKSPLTRLSGL